MIYVLAVGVSIGWDIAVWSDNYSLMGSNARSDHILYFLIIASIIGTRLFLKGTGKKSIRIISLISIATVIIGITTDVFCLELAGSKILATCVDYIREKSTGLQWIQMA